MFEAVRAAVDVVGAGEIRVSRSQVAFGRRAGFAYVWIPGAYLRSAAEVDDAVRAWIAEGGPRRPEGIVAGEPRSRRRGAFGIAATAWRLTLRVISLCDPVVRRS